MPIMSVSCNLHLAVAPMIEAPHPSLSQMFPCWLPLLVSKPTSSPSCSGVKCQSSSVQPVLRLCLPPSLLHLLTASAPLTPTVAPPSPLVEESLHVLRPTPRFPPDLSCLASMQNVRQFWLTSRAVVTNVITCAPHANDSNGFISY